MNNTNNPKPRNTEPPKEVPVSKDVFYATGVNIDVSPNELVITFDRFIPGTESEATTVVLNPNAIYQLKEGFSSLAEYHDQSMKNFEETGYYGEPPNNKPE